MFFSAAESCLFDMVCPSSDSFSPNWMICARRAAAIFRALFAIGSLQVRMTLSIA